MAIKVKHGAPAAVMLGRYAAGYAAQQKKAQLPALQAMEARKAREGEREFRREMTEEQRAFQRQMTGEGREYQAEQAELAHERRLEAQAFGAELESDQYEYRLTAQQKAKQEQLANILDDIENNLDMRPEEKRQAAEIARERFGYITPRRFRKEPKPDLGQLWGKEIFTHEGRKYWRNKETGEWKEVDGRDNMTQRWKIAIEAARDPDTGEVNMKTAKEIVAMMGGGGAGVPGADDISPDMPGRGLERVPGLGIGAGVAPDMATLPQMTDESQNLDGEERAVGARGRSARTGRFAPTELQAVEKSLARVQGTAPGGDPRQFEALNVEDIQDLATAQTQLDIAQQEARDWKKEMADYAEETRLFPDIQRGLKEREARMRDRERAIQERMKELRRFRDMLEARRDVLQVAKMRMGEGSR